MLSLTTGLPILNFAINEARNHTVGKIAEIDCNKVTVNVYCTQSRITRFYPIHVDQRIPVLPYRVHDHSNTSFHTNLHGQFLICPYKYVAISVLAFISILLPV